MPRPFDRGRVVARGGRLFGVVWHDSGGNGFELLAIELNPTEPRRAREVETNMPLPGAVILPRAIHVAAQGYEDIGPLPAATWELVAHAMMREAHHRMLIAKWAPIREHDRRNASTVRLAV